MIAGGFGHLLTVNLGASTNTASEVGHSAFVWIKRLLFVEQDLCSQDKQEPIVLHCYQSSDHFVVLMTTSYYSKCIIVPYKLIYVDMFVYTHCELTLDVI